MEALDERSSLLQKKFYEFETRPITILRPCSRTEKFNPIINFFNLKFLYLSYYYLGHQYRDCSIRIEIEKTCTVIFLHALDHFKWSKRWLKAQS